jgi:hypothetical protein
VDDSMRVRGNIGLVSDQHNGITFVVKPLE